MSRDFKEAIILLMQHPAMRTPLDELSYEELHKAYDLSCDLLDYMEDEEYTLLDYIQMARIQFFLGILADSMACDNEKGISYFKTGIQYLNKGGVDLSINKWTELVSLRAKE